MRFLLLIAWVVGWMSISPVHGIAFGEIRIGDRDGFGYHEGIGLLAAHGGNANRDARGLLTDGDFLPDLNRDGATQTGSGDDFDNRSAAEINGTFTTGSGFADTGTGGSQFTDISLARSYDRASAVNQVFDANGNTFGTGGPFPSVDSDTLPNQPGFVFDFSVNKADLIPGTPLFLNLVFGDYDVFPAQVAITTVRGDVILLNLMLQSNAQGQDGLIQAAFGTLGFSRVFADAGATWRGSVQIDFVAPDEPYTAFDYVEISVRAIGSTVPEPSTAGLGAIAVATLSLSVRRRG